MWCLLNILYYRPLTVSDKMRQWIEMALSYGMH